MEIFSEINETWKIIVAIVAGAGSFALSLKFIGGGINSIRDWRYKRIRAIIMPAVDEKLRAKLKTPDGEDKLTILRKDFEAIKEDVNEWKKRIDGKETS